MRAAHQQCLTYVRKERRVPACQSVMIEVLVHSAAAHHVQELESTTDSEHLDGLLGTVLEYILLDPVPDRIDIRNSAFLSTIEPRRHVLAAGEEHQIDLLSRHGPDQAELRVDFATELSEWHCIVR